LAKIWEERNKENYADLAKDRALEAKDSAEYKMLEKEVAVIDY
jgi:hypothetical protein